MKWHIWWRLVLSLFWTLLKLKDIPNTISMKTFTLIIIWQGISPEFTILNNLLLFKIDQCWGASYKNLYNFSQKLYYSYLQEYTFSKVVICGLNFKFCLFVLFELFDSQNQNEKMCLQLCSEIIILCTFRIILYTYSLILKVFFHFITIHDNCPKGKRT